MEHPEQGKDSILATAHLNVDDKTRPWTYFGAKRSASIHKSDYSGSTVEKEVEVLNGRKKEGLTLDEASFELVEDCFTSLSTEDFYAMQAGDAGLTKKYNDEISAYVKEKLKCDKVVVMHSQVRNGKKVGTDGIGPYVTGYPHTDSSSVSADEIAVSQVQLDQDKGDKYERYLYVNLWRNISDSPIENDHLAMLDERTTVKPDDYIAKDLFSLGYNVVQYGLNARHAATHKWYYFPNMKKDEGILFKQFDSDWTKPGRICFHMSVNDPKTKDYHPRESIEARMMCYWKKADSGVDSMPTLENTHADMIKDPLEVAEEASRSSWGFSLNPFTYLKKWMIPPKKPYSGNPEDYLKKFVGVVKYINFWPAQALTWARNTVNSGDSIDDGIKALTYALVKDDLGYNGTKSFTASQKGEIVNFLVKNEEYTNMVKKNFGSK